MGYSCKIILDSISEMGKRLTTFEITFPRCVLAEAETHRVIRGWGGNLEEVTIHNLGINVDENLSRNSASSRAIPISKMLEKVIDDPFIPQKWGKPAKGMGAKEYWPHDSHEHEMLTIECREALNRTIKYVQDYQWLANKEDLNRYLEPWLYHTAIVTATEWGNFFKLRTNEAADWKIKKIADLMYEAYHAFDNYDEKIHGPIFSRGNVDDVTYEQRWWAVKPQHLEVGQWHCPLVHTEDNELIHSYILGNIKELREQGFHLAEHLGDVYTHKAFIELQKRISVARCARVSYLTHDGVRSIEADLQLFDRLRTSGHWSPFEHVATPYFETGLGMYDADFRPSSNDIMTGRGVWSRNLLSGNFVGWKQFRKQFGDENCIDFRKEQS